MMAWLRTWVQRHLIADDPVPQYSRLDHADGLTGTVGSAQTEPAPVDPPGTREQD